eukprot:CAMPEP_0204335650 /NCGR_PEP_ID=MMETSP0469-20131031/18944_1 /ASSEMBLY_ACC=CAM_ASM_000384 /TAXON_ID=2969 /ORGANISM="Oxyrrhis marina" /LENGTH=160 /DNA_ID=CAMNT_0051319359 /DNA_START=32 /DNA_END=514 /DNA_ORIENTATION=+
MVRAGTRGVEMAIHGGVRDPYGWVGPEQFRPGYNYEAERTPPAIFRATSAPSLGSSLSSTYSSMASKDSPVLSPASRTLFSKHTKTHPWTPIFEPKPFARTAESYFTQPRARRSNADEDRQHKSIDFLYRGSSNALFSQNERWYGMSSSAFFTPQPPVRR